MYDDQPITNTVRQNDYLSQCRSDNPSHGRKVNNTTHLDNTQSHHRGAQERKHRERGLGGGFGHFKGTLVDVPKDIHIDGRFPTHTLRVGFLAFKSL